MYCQQLIKLEAQFVVNKGLFSCKIFFSTTIPNVVNIDKEKIARFDEELLHHPPYSPYLAPSDHHLFRSLSNSFND